MPARPRSTRSRELIKRGQHQEAVLWIVATCCRCRKLLHRDATEEEMREGFDPGYLELLNDIGITSLAGLRRRGERVERFLPRVREMAEAIMAANRSIED